MSHFTRIKTQMVESRFITASLDDLGYQYEVGVVKIKGYMGQQTKAQIRVPTKSPKFDIGFSRSNGHYEVVADWWGIKEIKQPVFVQEVSRRYAYHATKEKLAEQGFTLVEEQEEKSGRLHLVMRRVG